MEKKIYLLLLALIVNAHWSHAQQIAPSTYNSSGGSNVLNGNTYEWSIGEMVLVHTATNSNVILTQGLLQSSKNNGNSIKPNRLSAQLFTVFPIPTEDILYLQPNFSGKSTLAVAVFDITGREMLRDELHLKSGKELQQIKMANWAAGNYLLKVDVVDKGISFQDVYKITKR